MTEILSVLLAFPTVLFTAVTALCLFYWLFVILGALDIDTFDSVSGAGKGAVEGAVKGAFEGAAGALKGGAEGVTGAVKGLGADGADLGDVSVDGSASLLSFLHLRDAPVTVVFSLFSIFGLLVTGLYGLTFGVPSILVGIPLLLGSAVVSLLLTSFAVRPLAPLFRVNRAKRSSDFVGKIATISTGRVTDRFGQATLEDGGAGLILEIREGRSNDLKRGERVVLVHWDAAKEVFEVERMPEDLLGPPARIGTSALDDAAMPEAIQEAIDAAESATPDRVQRP